MKDLHNVALIILNYNTPEQTISAVRRILAQETGIRVVITDNASTDGSLEKFQCAFNESKEVAVVETGVNGGYAKGNNFGIAFAESLGDIRYIGVMNPDVELDAKDLLLLINALKANSSLGLVTGKVIYSGINAEPNPCAWKRASVLRWIFSVTMLGTLYRRFVAWLQDWDSERRKLPSQGFYSKEEYSQAVMPVYAVQGCLFFSRLENWKKIGGFDERTFLYWEEDILAEKVLHAGFHNAVVCDAWIRHNHQEKNKSLQHQGERLFHIRCGFDSRMVFLRDYSHYRGGLRTFLSLIWRVDFTLRKLLIPLFFRE